MTDQLAAAPLQPETPGRPFSGFLPRTGAFLADCFVLGAAAYLISESLRPALSLAKPWLPLLGQVLVFLYFWLMDGVSGQGQTLGKKLLGVRVVDDAGRQPASAAAARRALLKLPVFLPLVEIRLLALNLPLGARPAFFIAFQIVNIAAMTYFITLAAGLAMHPRKRAWHDLWAGTYVTRDPVPAGFHEALAAEVDPLASARMRNHLKMTLIFWLVATAALLIRPVRHLSDPELHADLERVEALERERPLDPYVVLAAQYPSDPARRQFEEQVQRYHQQSAAAGRQALTTDTLRRRVDDGQTIHIAAVLPRGTFDPAQLDDPAFRRQVERLRSLVWEHWRSRAAATSQPPPPALAFDLVLADPFQLLFEPLVMLVKNESEARARVTGPPDPELGPLVYELILAPPPAPAAQDPLTTSPATQPPGAP
ncbi:MAG: RDD family protein [candidate division BRC1 bacterium ADurb.BinA292]|nr:MAG: RDD family protein [candidate division BRC1 bacterium ADurb.BinA292]